MKATRPALLLALVLAACDADPPGNIPPDAGPDAALPDAAPPAPAPDLRFKLIGADDSFSMGCAIGGSVPCTISISTLEGGAGISFGSTSEYIYAPLGLDASGRPQVPDYTWPLIMFTPVISIEKLSGKARAGLFADLDTDVAELTGEHLMITSLDLKPESYGLTAAATLSGSPAYSSAGPMELTRDTLDAWVSDEAAAGRVVTALSARVGMIRAYSYTRAGDASAYETRVADATFATLVAAAEDLAADGFLITAIGQVDLDAFLLVGTRAAGVTAPRQIFSRTVPSLPQGDALQECLNSGYAIIANVDDSTNRVVLGER